ncbi:MAG TPA: DNA-directed RNA polymerase subunit beta', partial [Campylobacterales bacterium]|nr:DNA-directed RNA polymerase subunit beta' [Campylobacterales bacterium]
RGRISIIQSHDEITLLIQQGAQEQKYNVRKSDVAKTNELAGVGGKVDGKLFIPYKNGELIEEGDSIVEVIKEAWSVPTRIPFASEIKVEDGAPITQNIYSDAKGIVKYFLLKGDYIERIETIKKDKFVEEKGLFAVIVDDNNREAARHYIARGSLVKVEDNTLLDRGDLIAAPKSDDQVVIAEWDPYSEPIIAESNGVVKFQDIIAGVTAVEQFDELTGESRLTLNEYIPTSYKPAIILATEDNEVITYSLEPKTSIFVTDRAEVTIADILAKTPKAAQKSSDITSGLPRVSELFEARRPKDPAHIAKINGTVSFGKPLRGKKRLILTDEQGRMVEQFIDKQRTVVVSEGDFVHTGEKLTDGTISSHDILATLGEKALYEYIVEEVQMVYRRQGVNISDKHIEIIVSQMMRQVKVVDSGDSKFIDADLVSKKKFNLENEKVIRLYGEPAIAEPLLIGITRAAVGADSIISAASFQDTTKVLTSASIAGTVDTLEDLKENVVIGRLIPVGTGMVELDNVKFSVADSKTK